MDVDDGFEQRRASVQHEDRPRPQKWLGLGEAAHVDIFAPAAEVLLALTCLGPEAKI